MDERGITELKAQDTMMPYSGMHISSHLEYSHGAPLPVMELLRIS